MDFVLVLVFRVQAFLEGGGGGCGGYIPGVTAAAAAPLLCFLVNADPIYESRRRRFVAPKGQKEEKKTREEPRISFRERVRIYVCTRLEVERGKYVFLSGRVRPSCASLSRVM